MPIRHMPRATAFAGLLALAACGGGADNNLAALDNELMGNGVDPALTSALEDQILVDPNLVQQAHPNSVRPPESPVQAQYPAGPDPTQPPPRLAASGRSGGTRVQAATASTIGQQTGGCGASLSHGPEWAGRLPAEFPAYPGGRVTEAAGTTAGDCRMRVVTFTTGDPHNRVLEYYRSLATRAGFSAEVERRGEDLLLGGVNARTDGAYVVIVTPRQNGTEVALVVNNGR